MSDQSEPRPGSDRDASHSGQRPSRQSALARIRDICRLVKGLIQLVPHTLPVIGRPPAVKFLSDHDRRPVVEKWMAKITLSDDEWDGLCEALPEVGGEIRLLARTIDDLRGRFDEEDRELQAENDALSQAYEDQVARGVENPRYRHIWEPERRIYPRELDWLRSYSSQLATGLDLIEGARSDRETEGVPAPDSPTGTPPADGQSAGAGASESKTPPPAEPLELVTLNQAASIVHKSKRTLERYKTKGKLPAPAVEGGGGKADFYDWKIMRPWLESEFGIKLPETFPANRRHA